LRLVEDRVHLPVRRGKVHAAGGDVHFAVLVEVAHRRALAAELVVQPRALERDLGRGLLLGVKRRNADTYHADAQHCRRETN
jgi:hypothetical protein